MLLIVPDIPAAPDLTATADEFGEWLDAVTLAAVATFRRERPAMPVEVLFAYVRGKVRDLHGAADSYAAAVQERIGHAGN